MNDCINFTQQKNQMKYHRLNFFSLCATPFSVVILSFLAKDIYFHSTTKPDTEKKLNLIELASHGTIIYHISLQFLKKTRESNACSKTPNGLWGWETRNVSAAKAMMLALGFKGTDKLKINSAKISKERILRNKNKQTKLPQNKIPLYPLCKQL